MLVSQQRDRSGFNVRIVQAGSDRGRQHDKTAAPCLALAIVLSISWGHTTVSELKAVDLGESVATIECNRKQNQSQRPRLSKYGNFQGHLHAKPLAELPGHRQHESAQKQGRVSDLSFGLLG